MRVGGKKITVEHKRWQGMDLSTVHADGEWIGHVSPATEGGGWVGWPKRDIVAPVVWLLEPNSPKVLHKATARGIAKAVAKHVLLGYYRLGEWR